MKNLSYIASPQEASLIAISWFGGLISLFSFFCIIYALLKFHSSSGDAEKINEAWKILIKSLFFFIISLIINGIGYGFQLTINR